MRYGNGDHNLRVGRRDGMGPGDTFSREIAILEIFFSNPFHML